MNATIRKKTEDLEKLATRARTIVAEFKDGLPDEQKLAVSQLLDRAKELKVEIDSEADLEQKKVDLANIDRYLREPIHQIPHGVNADDESRKSLLRAGWEVKGGFICGPSSLEGKTITYGDGQRKTMGKTLMYPEEVLFGEIPTDDADVANYYRKTRAIFQPEYKAAFGHYLVLCTKHRTESMAFNMLSGAEQKALSAGTDTAGGFILPPDVMSEMLAHQPQSSIFRQYARVQPTNRDVLLFPAVAPNAGTYNGISGASIYSSGFVGSWVGETPAFSDTDPSFQNFPIAVKKVRVATKLSNDFVADSSTNIMAWLAQNGSINMGLTEDAGFINGDGSPLQPLGILNAGIATVDVEGSTANLVNNTAAAQGSAPKISTLFYTLPAQYAAGAKWLMRRTMEGKIRALVDGSGRPLWTPFVGSGFADTPPTLFGAQVLHSDWMPDDGTDGNQVLLLANLSQYIIAQRTQITSVVLRERFADTDQLGIILFERVGGALYNTDSARIGKV